MLLQSSASRTSAFRSQRAARAVRDVRMAALSQDELKKQAAFKAVEYVKSGMVVGLGTGSTAAFAVDRSVLAAGFAPCVHTADTNRWKYSTPGLAGLRLAFILPVNMVVCIWLRTDG